MKKKGSITLVIIALLAASVGIIGFVVLRNIESNFEELANMTFAEIYLDEIPDETTSALSDRFQ